MRNTNFSILKFVADQGRGYMYYVFDSMHHAKIKVSKIFSTCRYSLIFSTIRKRKALPRLRVAWIFIVIES